MPPMTSMTSTPSIYHEQAQLHGLQESHRLMLAQVPRAARVLDVGCASGYLAAAALRDGARWADGIEPFAPDAALARAHCRVVVEGSAEDPSVWSGLEGPYDAIIFGDVLEHLAHPERALAYAHNVLADDGRIIASLPNVAHYSVRAMLLSGRFEYADHGILDRTHLRFFTRRELVSLFEQSGFSPTQVDPILALPKGQLALFERFLGYRRTQRWAMALALRAESLFAFQFVVTAHPSRR